MEGKNSDEKIHFVEENVSDKKQMIYQSPPIHGEAIMRMVLFWLSNFSNHSLPLLEECVSHESIESEESIDTDELELFSVFCGREAIAG